jgi:hypothetical protein
MPKCNLCGTDFDYKGLWAHKRKKQSCISQKQITLLYKNLHKLMKCTLTSEIPTETKKVTKIIETIKDTIESVGEPNNIDRHSFGYENTDIVTKNFDRLVKANKESFFMFVSLVYCNPELPKNKTIRVTSLQGKYCKIYKDGEWIIEGYDKVMRKLAKVFMEIMNTSKDEKFEDYMTSICNVTLKREKECKKFSKYTRATILPILYNISKKEKD